MRGDHGPCFIKSTKLGEFCIRLSQIYIILTLDLRGGLLLQVAVVLVAIFVCNSKLGKAQ